MIAQLAIRTVRPMCRSLAHHLIERKIDGEKDFKTCVFLISLVMDLVAGRPALSNPCFVTIAPSEYIEHGQPPSLLKLYDTVSSVRPRIALYQSSSDPLKRCTMPKLKLKWKPHDGFSEQEEEDQERLSWRMDPVDSHSDWTIEVSVLFGSVDAGGKATPAASHLTMSTRILCQ